MTESPKRGIRTQAVHGLLDQLDSAGFAMHGLLIMRDGQTLAQGYYAPFCAESPHRMYSITKSLVAIAMGLLEAEGRISLEDRIVTFFADKCTPSLHPFLRDTTIRDLLRMATPYPKTTYTLRDADWTKTFFTSRPAYPPGTLFAYNTSAATVLAALVERLSGESLLAYLGPRLLQPLGFSQGARCILTPEGSMWGGSGLICTLQDVARLGQFLMQEGQWNGRQLLPAAFARAMVRVQTPGAGHGFAGYGYQTWCLPDGGFLLLGMGSQCVYCYPDKGLLLACMADTQAQGARASALLTEYVQAFVRQADGVGIEAPPGTEDVLRQRLAGLSLRLPDGAADSPRAGQIHGVRYRLAPNAMKIDSACITFSGDSGLFEYTKTGVAHRIAFGQRRFFRSEFPERIFGSRVGTLDNHLPPCLAAGVWLDENTLRIQVYLIGDHLGSLQIDCAFIDNGIALRMEKAAEWFLVTYQGVAGGCSA